MLGRVWGKVLAVKGAVTVAAVVVTAGTAAAATGALPGLDSGGGTPGEPSTTVEVPTTAVDQESTSTVATSDESSADATDPSTDTATDHTTEQTTEDSTTTTEATTETSVEPGDDAADVDETTSTTPRAGDVDESGTPNDPAANDHGKAVSAVAHDDSLVGGDHGAAVSATARDNPGNGPAASGAGRGRGGANG
jgi:hypothetical protein